MQDRKLWLVAWFLFIVTQRCFGDGYVLAPTPPPGQRGGPLETATIYPFLIKQLGSPPAPTIRYQQVYNASLFTNVDPSLIYVTSFSFNLDWRGTNVFSWTVPSMQINLSTTSKRADSLSSVFAENVGPDDKVVLGPTSYQFPGGMAGAAQLVEFDRAFWYYPSNGNLLLDVRIFDGSGTPDPFNRYPIFNAFGSSTDEVSRVGSTNVNASTATVSDTIGLTTVIQFSPLPTLIVYVGDGGAQSNYIFIQWRSQPPQFTLQRSATLGQNSAWENITRVVTPNTGYQTYSFPISTAGNASFFRLIGPGP